MNLGTRISAWRKSRGLTQSKLAKTCRITVSAVSLWESGETSPSQKNLEKIVKRLGLTMERFYGALPEDAS